MPEVKMSLPAGTAGVAHRERNGEEDTFFRDAAGNQVGSIWFMLKDNGFGPELVRNTIDPNNPVKCRLATDGKIHVQGLTTPA